MEQKFESKQEVLDYIDYLEMKGRTVPEWVTEELRRFEAAEKVNTSEYIYSTMAANNKFMTPEKDKVVRETVDQILTDAPNATQPCLLLGKVQCGKTDTFLSIMGLCFDKGIDIAIVMTKGTNTLTEQTLKRLNKDFRFFKDNETYSQEVVVSIYDIMDLYPKGGLTDYQLSDKKQKFIIVCKKETTNLAYLNELFDRDPVMCDKRVLICDDEADFASRAYLERKKELTLLKIAEQIEELRKKPHYCRYLQITATPYSLYLQPDGTIKLRDGEASSWLPRYTGLVPIHDKYVGGKQYYVLSEDDESMYSCLYEEVSEECIGILSARNDFYLQHNAHSEMLKPLSYAVISYLFGAAIRRIQLRKKEDKKYKSSCLIHCEISKQNHAWQEKVITEIIEAVKKAVLEKGNTDLHILDLESDAYESLRISNELANKQNLINEKFPSFGEVEAEIKHILQHNDYTINVVNSDEPVKTMLNEQGQLNLERTLNFFIGGSILDRGITIDNMLCFFYGRDPKKFQMDTVLQHARMYGARDKEDMACTRFFTTEEIYDVLKTMNTFDECLYDYLKAHRDTVQTNDFTSIVIGYDKRIAPSSQSKYKPANTKVLKPHQRILPVGFQTGTEEEIGDTIKRIDELVQSCTGASKVTEEDPFFLMPYEVAAEIIGLIASTHRYGEEYENKDYEWDATEMYTALEHNTFGTDGYIWCLLKTDRDMSRERDKSKEGNGKRWIDAPDTTRIDTKPAREKALDRPVLMLLRQNGREEQGWRGTPFYWPVFVSKADMTPGIFTINGKKKTRDLKKQYKLATIDQYAKEDVLTISVSKEILFKILLGYQKKEDRRIMRTTANLYLAKDIFGNVIQVESTDPNKYYDYSTLNGGVFPFELAEYKYIHFKASQDFSGSQILVALDPEKATETVYLEYEQKDLVYDQYGDSAEATDKDVCEWYVRYHLGNILDSKLTPEDEQLTDAYKEYFEEEYQAIKALENDTNN